MMFLTHASCLLAGVVFGIIIINLIFTAKSINLQIRKGYLDEWHNRIARK